MVSVSDGTGMGTISTEMGAVNTINIICGDGNYFEEHVGVGTGMETSGWTSNGHRGNRPYGDEY